MAEGKGGPLTEAQIKYIETQVLWGVSREEAERIARNPPPLDEPKTVIGPNMRTLGEDKDEKDLPSDDDDGFELP